MFLPIICIVGLLQRIRNYTTTLLVIYIYIYIYWGTLLIIILDCGNGLRDIQGALDASVALAKRLHIDSDAIPHGNISLNFLGRPSISACRLTDLVYIP